MVPGGDGWVAQMIGPSLKTGTTAVAFVFVWLVSGEIERKRKYGGRGGCRWGRRWFAGQCRLLN